MDKTFESQTLNKKQLAILIFIGGLIGGIVVYFIQRAIAGQPLLVEEATYINLLLTYLIGLLLSAWYFIRDYVMYDGLTLHMKDNKLQFIRKNNDKSEFGFLELKNFREMRIFYSMFGVVKVTLQLKSSVDFRRYQKVILLPLKARSEFLIALDDNVKKAQKHKSTRVEPK